MWELYIFELPISVRFWPILAAITIISNKISYSQIDTEGGKARERAKTVLLVSDPSPRRAEGGWLEARDSEGRRGARYHLWALRPLSCS